MEWKSNMSNNVNCSNATEKPSQMTLYEITMRSSDGLAKCRGILGEIIQKFNGNTNNEGVRCNEPGTPNIISVSADNMETISTICNGLEYLYSLIGG